MEPVLRPPVSLWERNSMSAAIRFSAIAFSALCSLIMYPAAFILAGKTRIRRRNALNIFLADAG